jgi:pilus assembly protein CpaB
MISNPVSSNTPAYRNAMARLKSPLVLLLVAALLAGGVSWLAYRYLQQREAALKEEITASGRKGEVRRVSVAVPREDTAPGTVLNTNTFVARPVEEDLVYPDTVLASDFQSMEGLKLARPVLRGRPLRLTDVQAPEVHDVAAVLPAGYRALTIDMDNINSIAQTLRPNHHIDIFLVSSGGSTGGDTATREQVTLYMQDMVVLATGTEFTDVTRNDGAAEQKMVPPGEVRGKERSYDTVTLLVTPAQAAKLMVGQKMGTYRVALRGTRDRDVVHIGPVGANGSQRRDAGIEFIVGGKGDKMVSQLTVPPSQDPRLAMLGAVQAQIAQATQASRPAAAANTQSNTITVPATRTNSVLPSKE